MRAKIDRVRVGVLGAGGGQTLAALCHNHPNAETVAMCDTRRERLAAAARSLDIAGLKSYADLNEFLRHPMDAVVVCSDAPMHAEHVVICLEAGFHVQSEVPMDYTYEGCLAIINAVERTGLKYMLAENYQYVPCWPRLRKWVKRGKLGQVVYCEGEYVHDCRALHWVVPLEGAREPRHPATTRSRAT